MSNRADRPKAVRMDYDVRIEVVILPERLGIRAILDPHDSTDHFVVASLDRPPRGLGVCDLLGRML